MTTPPLPTPQQPLVVKGSRGDVTFDGWTITVRHTALGNRNTATVTLDQLTGVDLKPASLASGLFTLLAAGTTAPQRKTLVTRAPLSVAINPGQTKRFEHLRDVLLGAMQALRTAPPPWAQMPAPAQPSSLAGELERLAALLRDGVISPQEFEQAKARLLGGQP
jgi:hypothetical protein